MQDETMKKVAIPQIANTVQTDKKGSKCTLKEWGGGGE